jgi:hypothetical protein
LVDFVALRLLERCFERKEIQVGVELGEFFPRFSPKESRFSISNLPEVVILDEIFIYPCHVPNYRAFLRSRHSDEVLRINTAGIFVFPKLTLGLSFILKPSPPSFGPQQMIENLKISQY